MILLLRIVLTGAFIALLRSAATESSANLNADVINAGRFALAIVVGFAASATWAPLLGKMVAGPVTGMLTDGSVSDENPKLVRWARGLAMQGHRRTAVFLSFVEGVIHPHLPAAFVIGMDNSGSSPWLQYCFAREVWRFNNVVNCLRAYYIMKSYTHREPPWHSVPEINLALIANLRPPQEPAEILPVPAAPPPPPLKRNERIKLFKGAEDIGPAVGLEDGASVENGTETGEAARIPTI